MLYSGLTNLKDLIYINEDGLYWPIDCGYTYAQLKRTLTHFDTFEKLLKGHGSMVQAGGNCGLALMPYIDKFQNIYTFEPDPVNFYCLNLNVDKKNIHKFQACLSDEHKLISLSKSDINDNGSFYIENIETGHTICLKIDDLNLIDCDLIFLDIEGYELHALNGAIETIKRCKPLICVEMCEHLLQRANSSQSKLLEFFINNKYELKGTVDGDSIFIYQGN